MDKTVTSTFRFDDYKVDFINYIFNPNFEYKEPIEIDFEVDIKISSLEEQENMGKVSLITKVFKDAQSMNLPFSLEVSVSGFFSSNNPITKEEFTQFCTVNGTTALFPFLRSVIADITRLSNIDTLLLPLVNIHRLIEKKIEESGK